MARKKICGIYKITNKVNGKNYIGQSIDIYDRWTQHIKDFKCNSKKHNKHFIDSWNKYGKDNFEFEIVEECTIEELNDKEIYWISYYNSNDKNYGYNKTTGGGQGSLISEESKMIISKKLKDRAMIINNKKIYQLSKSGEIIKIWSNNLEIRDTLNIDISVIVKCCKKVNNRKSYNGFIWVYEEDYLSDNFDINYYINKHNTESIQIIVMDLDYNFISEYNSVYEASKNLNIPQQHIFRNINGTTSKVREFRIIDKENYQNNIKTLFNGRGSNR